MVSVATGFRAAEVTLVPMSIGDRQQSSPAEGHWRGMVEDKDARGHDGTAPPCSSPYSGTLANARAGREGPICAGAQTSAVPPGAFLPDNEPS